MSSLRVGLLVVNMFLSGICRGCRGRLDGHLPSRRYPPDRPVPAIIILLGVCYPEGTPCPQKISWAQMGEILTEAEYRKKYSAKSPPLERCPVCRSKLRHHGRYPRGLTRGGAVAPIFIYRGLCRNRRCPVVTVTHFPCFIIPYKVVSAEVIEKVVRERVEQDLTWEEMSEEHGFDIKTMFRWYRSVLKRAKEIMGVLLFQEERYAPAKAAGLPPVREETLLGDMFGVADRVAGLLADLGLWREEVSRLSIVRAAPPAGVGPVPVWVW